VTTTASSIQAALNGRGAALSGLARMSGWVTYALIVVLLVEALFEGWLRALLAHGAVDGTTVAGLDVASWVKAVRNGGYLALGVSSLIHVVAKRQLHLFLKPVDVAFVLLAVVLLVAGLAGGSSVVLTLHGMFVYLRGAILFYAVRALAPDWSRARPVVWLVGAIVALNVAIAVIQGLLGAPAYTALGFTDLTWANAHRAQGLLSHPNHLGHIVGLSMLGVVAWNLRHMRFRWWILFGFLALGLALAQSRESSVAVLVGIVAIAFLQSGYFRKLVGALVVTIVVTGLVWTVQPGSWRELTLKIGGVISAVQVPSGAESGQSCDPATQDCTATGLPRRATRVLFYQQGLRLWLGSPLLGYGVGQFGGGVASQHNPDWNLNPRFGPEGFNLHGFQGTQVDSFWLHLVVETGAIGTAAYVLWIALLGFPSVRRSWRARYDRNSGAVTAADHPGDRWAPVAILFGGVVAGFSPALEDPLFPPLLFGILGLAWTLGRGSAPEQAPDDPAAIPSRA